MHDFSFCNRSALPYLVGYRSRDGRTIRNDDNSDWLKPAYAQMFRVLKNNAFCLSFYGWQKVERFTQAFEEAGFRRIGHIAFTKRYSSRKDYLAAQHECAYLLAKGYPKKTDFPPGDVADFVYTGNHLHPTEKPVMSLMPYALAFCPKGGLLLDPFCGSGAMLKAARLTDRDFLGIEIDPQYHAIAHRRLTAEMPQ